MLDSLSTLLHYEIDEISTILGIENYVAKIIFDAAKKFDETKQRSNLLEDSVVAV